MVKIQRKKVLKLCLCAGFCMHNVWQNCNGIEASDSPSRYAAPRGVHFNPLALSISALLTLTRKN